MKLIQEKELYFFGNNIASKTSAHLIMRVLGLQKINKLYGELYKNHGIDLTSKYFKYLNSTYNISEKEISNIPTTGPLIIVSNHPTGTFDGILLIDILGRVRPDVKFMSNQLISRIEPLKDYFIDVDAFDNKNAKNISGVRKCMEHVAAGGVLVVFPAGEISTYKHPFGEIRDKKWAEPVIKFIRKANVPVLPIHIDAHNSRMFHMMGQIHPMLRTIMIPHETINKTNLNVTVRIGSVISTRKQDEFQSVDALGRYLRSNVYCMNAEKKQQDIGVKTESEKTQDLDNIADPADREALRNEIESIQEYKLFSYGDFAIYFTTSTIIPTVMHEIGRMREVTFREIGEGTNATIDTDNYDTYYHQLFVWDHANNALVGAYRVGMGLEIMPNYGVNGFYTNSLFRISPKMSSVMEHTIELGRSFIVKEYQRKPASLMLLWKGILYILLKNDRYRYLMGPVTMSGKLSDTSKSMIINYINNHHLDQVMAQYVKPVTGLAGLNLKKFDYSLIEDVTSIDSIDKLVMDTEKNEFGVPILLKKYLQLNGKILGFNVDHAFNDSIDALMLLDIKLIPENKIAMLSKELEIDVMSRFRDE